MKSAWDGTGIIIRNNLLKNKIKQIQIDNNILSNRLTHIQITSNETINILSIYAPSKCSTPKITYYKQLNEYFK